jgi:hypothetical protein
MAGRYSSLFFLSRFQAELDRLFKEALELDAGEVPAGGWQPAVDIVETASSILILVELPGCAAADLKLEVNSCSPAAAPCRAPSPRSSSCAPSAARDASAASSSCSGR